MAVSTKAFSKFASDSPIDFGSDFCEKSIQNRARIGLECSCPPKSALLVENLQKKPFSDHFPPQNALRTCPWSRFGVILASLGSPWAPFCLPGGSTGGLWRLFKSVLGPARVTWRHQGSIWEGFYLQNNQKWFDLTDFWIIFGTEIDGGCWWFVVRFRYRNLCRNRFGIRFWNVSLVDSAVDFRWFAR